MQVGSNVVTNYVRNREQLGVVVGKLVGEEVRWKVYILEEGNVHEIPEGRLTEAGQHNSLVVGYQVNPSTSLPPD